MAETSAGWTTYGTFSLLFIADLAAQPGAGHAPIALNRGGRNLHRFRRLFNGQPAEITPFRDPRLLRIERLHPPERVIEREQIDVAFVSQLIRLAESQPVLAPASLGRPPASRALDQDVAHSHGGDAEEVRPVLPIDLFFINQPQVDLMNQVGGLERVTGALRAQIISGQASQLTVDQRRQFIERSFVAIAPPDEHLSYVRRGCHQFLYMKAKVFWSTADRIRFHKCAPKKIQTG